MVRWAVTVEVIRTGSEIIAQVTSQEGKPPRMPKNKEPLLDTQVALIRKWIEQGADWKGHWSYIPPVRPPVPAVFPSPSGRGQGEGAVNNQLFAPLKPGSHRARLA